MSKLFSKFINEPNFLKVVEYKINEIKKDGVIDCNDIPHIISIVYECSKNVKHIKVNKKNLKEELEELIIYLLKDLDLINIENEKKLLGVLNSSLDLVLLPNRIKKYLFCF